MFSCVLCNFKLETKEALQEHFRKHANKEIDNKGRYRRGVAETVDPTAELPSTSTTNVADVSRITCDVCFVEFDTITSAIQHKFRKHPESNVKHFCGYCGMQFPLKFTHDKHLSTHFGTSDRGSFPCTDCGVPFYNTQALNYHVKSIHKRIHAIFKPVATPPPSKKIKINNANEAQSAYYCYLCGQEYIIKFNLQKHLEKSHSAAERDIAPTDLIKCITCDALFYNKKAYENHNMYHKSDDLYVTSEEQRLQTVSRVDQDFDIRRVQLQADKFIPIEKPSNRRRYKRTINSIEKNNCKSSSSSSSTTKRSIDSSSDDEMSPASSVDSSDSDSDCDNEKTNSSSDNKTIEPNVRGRTKGEKRTTSEDNTTVKKLCATKGTTKGKTKSYLSNASKYVDDRTNGNVNANSRKDLNVSEDGTDVTGGVTALNGNKQLLPVVERCAVPVLNDLKSSKEVARTVVLRTKRKDSYGLKVKRVVAKSMAKS